MHVELRCHPDSPCDAVARIEVGLSRAGTELVLLYRVTGAIGALALPQPAAPARMDELWKHSCFEAFVRIENEPGYTEYNFAPSRAWAAYRFDAYRKGMRDAEGTPPRIAIRRDADRFELEAAMALPGDATRIGLSAVIEEGSGRKSWWALAHPPGAPDFHHSDCFALELPAAMRA